MTQLRVTGYMARDHCGKSLFSFIKLVIVRTLQSHCPSLSYQSSSHETGPSITARIMVILPVSYHDPAVPRSQFVRVTLALKQYHHQSYQARRFLLYACQL